MKICTKCGIAQPEEDFRITNKQTVRRETWCKKCNSAYHAAIIKARYASDPEYRQQVIANTVARKTKNKKQVDEYLFKHPCKECGEKDIKKLEFHHRNTKDKIAAVSTLASTGRRWAIVKAEIAKCDVLCGECHKKRTKTKAPKYAAKNKEKLAKYLLIHPCVECGSYKNLEFHHRDPKDKIAAVTTLVGNDKSWSKCMAEMEKCDVLCRRCHKDRHWGQSWRKCKQELALEQTEERSK